MVGRRRQASLAANSCGEWRIGWMCRNHSSTITFANYNARRTAWHHTQLFLTDFLVCFTHLSPTRLTRIQVRTITAHTYTHTQFALGQTCSRSSCSTSPIPLLYRIARERPVRNAAAANWRHTTTKHNRKWHLDVSISVWWQIAAGLRYACCLCVCVVCVDVGVCRTTDASSLIIHCAPLFYVEQRAAALSICVC